jgi:hypothetical protein
MLAPPAPATPAQVVQECLRAGGATDLRAAPDRVWIVGHAPSGALFELYEWPGHGFYVSRRSPSSEPGQRLGVFPSWRVAVGCALRA